MLTKLMPHELMNAIKKLNIAKLTEIRLRVGKPVIVHYGGIYYLSNDTFYNPNYKNDELEHIQHHTFCSELMSFL